MNDPQPKQARGLERFLAELKRRQVFKVTALYGAAGFALVQAVDVFVPALRLPSSVTTTIALLVIIGFPVALVVAWVYEVSAHGVRRTQDAKPGELEAIATSSARTRWPVGIAAILGAALIGLSAWWLAIGRIGEGRSYDSIAVLPLANLSGNPEFDYFGDGLSEELLNALAGLDDLRVAARTSSFAFKNQGVDIRTIGDSLGVETVLEGSVRRSEDRVRVALQLIEAESGFGLWSEDFDRPLAGILALQDEIAASVVSTLLPRLRGEDAARVRGGTADIVAHDEYLLGLQKWHTREVPALREAVEHFRRATERDSSFALAWSGLADAIDALAFRDTSELKLVPEARLAALHALALDPELAEAWASIGMLAGEFDWDQPLAQRALRRAIALRPSYAHAQRTLGSFLRNLGRVDESLRHFELAVQLDPLSGLAREAYALALHVAGDKVGAREQYEIAADLAPAAGSGAAIVWHAADLGLTADEAAQAAVTYATAAGLPEAASWELVGRGIVDPSLRERARAFLAEAPELDEFVRHQVSLALGNHEDAVEYLEAQRAVGGGDLHRIGVLPQYDPLRSHPLVLEIVRELGVPNGYDPVARAPVWPEPAG